jgi:hypothetical protein
LPLKYKKLLNKNHDRILAWSISDYLEFEIHDSVFDFIMDEVNERFKNINVCICVHRNVETLNENSKIVYNTVYCIKFGYEEKFL